MVAVGFLRNCNTKAIDFRSATNRNKATQYKGNVTPQILIKAVYPQRRYKLERHCVTVIKVTASRETLSVVGIFNVCSKFEWNLQSLLSKQLEGMFMCISCRMNNEDTANVIPPYRTFRRTYTMESLRSLFYLTNIVCHFPWLFQRACRRATYHLRFKR
jgi:hypothetical protein